MASTYVNNLRLNEMATGDASGTWGTTTNTNLELIGEALGYGTEAITTNADTHTSTVADGASDAARAMYVKYTGTLDSACTITIAPNTMKRVQIIENATSGSQSIIIKQGSGSTVTIPTGRVAVVYLDGAGSGGAVVNAFTDLDLAGTLSIAGAVAAATDMTVGDDLTLSSDAGVLGFGADTDVTLTHVADTGLLLNSSRQLQFGDSGTYIHQSADGVLDLVADTEIEINATTIDINGAVDISGNALVSGEVQTANIGFTDGDNAITIADGGGITAAAGITSTAASNTFGATSFNDADITNVGSIALDTITNDGTDITIDSSGDIVLDADGGDIQFKDGGTAHGNFLLSGSDFTIGSSQNNGDLIFRGIDGGADVTALTLDMSNAGKAAFNAGASFASNVSISTADNTDTLTLVSTDADASVGPVLVFDRTSSSPADNDRVGSIVFQARNDAAEDTDYFTNNVQIKDASNGTEDAAVEFNIMRAGTLTSMMQFDVSETVFNDGSLDTDFRVESNGNANMLFVDAGNDRVGIGISPEQILHIKDTSNPGATTGSVIIEGARDGIANCLEIRSRDASNPTGVLPINHGQIIRFTGFDGTDFEEMAMMGTIAEANVADGDAPSSLFFGTTPDGAGAATEKMRITNAGFLGIGTTSPGLPLDVRGNQGSPASSGTTQVGSLSIRGTGSHFMTSGMLNVSPYTGWFQSQDANNLSVEYPLALNPNGGNVGINTTTPNAPLTIQTESATGSRAGLRINNPFGFDDLNTGCEIIFSQDRSASEDFKMAAIVSGQDSGGSSADGNLKFFTRASSSISERVRINASGRQLGFTSVNLEPGNTPTDANCYVIGPGYMFLNRDDEAVVNQITFGKNGSVAGSISTSSSTAYNTTSDYRRKENITPLVNGLERLNKLNPVSYTWIDDKVKVTEEGFIAHEVQEAGWTTGVQGEKDGEEMQGMDYGRITPLLVKAIQEQQKQIDNLQSEINLLKGE